eukprot:358752-Chlamydomonas_euryale.AAC.9
MEASCTHAMVMTAHAADHVTCSCALIEQGSEKTLVACMFSIHRLVSLHAAPDALRILKTMSGKPCQLTRKPSRFDSAALPACKTFHGRLGKASPTQFHMHAHACFSTLYAWHLTAYCATGIIHERLSVSYVAPNMPLRRQPFQYGDVRNEERLAIFFYTLHGTHTILPAFRLHRHPCVVVLRATLLTTHTATACHLGVQVGCTPERLRHRFMLPDLNPDVGAAVKADRGCVGEIWRRTWHARQASSAACVATCRASCSMAGSRGLRVLSATNMLAAVAARRPCAAVGAASTCACRRWC